MLWDVLNGRQALAENFNPWDWSFDRVEEGWREDPNGPAEYASNRFGVTGGNFMGDPFSGGRR